MNIAAIYPIKPRFHEPNVSLIARDEVIFAYEEEKLSRSRSEYTNQGYPVMGLYAALKKANLRPDQIDIWALVGPADDVFADFTTLLKHLELIHFVPELKINRVPHHLAHAALSVFTSPFEECLFISMDGGSGSGCTVIGTFMRNSIQEIHRSTGSHLSDFWSDMTHYLGFKKFEEEKLMGLAAYGKVDEKLYLQLRSILWVSEDGLGVVYRHPIRTLHQDIKGFNYDNFSPFSATYPQFHFNALPYIREVSKPDIAATVQKLTEDYVVEITTALLKKTGLRHLALSGSLFQNAKLNGLLHELQGVESIHVPIAAGDAGLSLGAALYTLWEKTGKRPCKEPLSPYLGPVFDSAVMEKEIISFGLKYHRSSDIAKEAARLVSQGMVVGWFQEAGEYGPRALGARSILADPRNPQAKVRINKLLHNPDWYLPYSSSILEEYVGDYFHHGCKAPYITLALKAIKKKAAMIPSAIHVDGTAMPQTVSKSRNRRYYELIKEFEKLAGIPLILNAGFHRCGLPPVCTPNQALEHLCMGCVDVLALGDFLVERKFVPRGIYEETNPEARKILDLKFMPVIDLAITGKRDRAVKYCKRLGICSNRGIEILIEALSSAREKKDLITLLMEQLIYFEQENGKTGVGSPRIDRTGPEHLSDITGPEGGEPKSTDETSKLQAQAPENKAYLR